MMDPNAPKYVKETLNWVNRIRAALGHRPLGDLPQGEPSHDCLCPVSRSIGMSTNEMVIATQDEVIAKKLEKILGEPIKKYSTYEWVTPPYVRKFVWNFDNEIKTLDRYIYQGLSEFVE